MKDTEELVSLQLDTQRNKILGAEMMITIVSSFFALGAFVVRLLTTAMCCLMVSEIDFVHWSISFIDCCTYSH